MKFIQSLIIGGALMLGLSVAQAGTLDDVKARGTLNCGVSTSLAGFSYIDSNGEWAGFDVAVCRAVAAAVLGNSKKVNFKPTTAKERFTVLRSGEIDMLARNTTWTFSRDVDLQLTFIGVNYYDGQGFMAPASLEVKSATELDGASVCIQTGTTTELNLADYFRVNGMSYEPVVVETDDEAREYYLAGRCDVYTTDRSGLAATRSTFENPNDHVVLPEVVSKEPLGPLVRQGDDQWADVVRWVLNVMIIGEEIGLSSSTLNQMANAGNPEVDRMLGKDGSYHDMIGLEKNWVRNVISQVGNYGEVYTRELNPIGLSARGVNAQWKDGGLIYAPPFR